MHPDEIKGKLKETEGKIQEGFGNMADRPVDQEAGAEKQVEGKLENLKGKVKDGLHKAIG